MDSERERETARKIERATEREREVYWQATDAERERASEREREKESERERERERESESTRERARERESERARERERARESERERKSERTREREVYRKATYAESGRLWEGYHESRRCSRETYPESYMNKRASYHIATGSE